MELERLKRDGASQQEKMEGKVKKASKRGVVERMG